MLLGSAGTLAGLAGIAGIWIFTQRIVQPIDFVFEQATNISATLGQGADTVTGRIQDSRQSVVELDENIEQVLDGLLSSAGLDPDRVEQIRWQLQALSQRVEDWKAFVDMAGQLIEQVVDMAESSLRFITSDHKAQGELRTALGSGRDELTEALQLFDEIRLQFDALSKNPPTASSAGKLEKLFVRIDQTFGLLEEHSTAFSQAVQELEQSARDLHDRILRRLRMAMILLTVLLLWQSIAQICLFRCGYRMRSGGFPTPAGD